VIERTANQDLVVAVSLWVGVGALLAVAATLMALRHIDAALLVGDIALALSAFAAVRHVRYYAVRICELLRRVNRIDESPTEEPSLPLQRVR
jgi:hypothetical protein